VRLEGDLVESVGSKQGKELKVKDLKVIGSSNSEVWSCLVEVMAVITVNRALITGRLVGISITQSQTSTGALARIRPFTVKDKDVYIGPPCS
jgi:aspartyl/asparaginyl-tRNA synthetase